MTSLFHDIIFGPVHSRRLGLRWESTSSRSPRSSARSTASTANAAGMPKHPADAASRPRGRAHAAQATLRRMVADGTPPDVITFAGKRRADHAPRVRSRHRRHRSPCATRCAPRGKVSVLSQRHADPPRQRPPRPAARGQQHPQTRLGIRDATVRRMNNPQNASYSVRSIVEAMKRFDGRMILQTMFLRGECGGQPSTTPPKRRSRPGSGSSPKSARGR